MNGAGGASDRGGATGGPVPGGANGHAPTLEPPVGGWIAHVEAEPGVPVLRWASRAKSIADIQRELARIWSQPDLSTDLADDGRVGRHIAARTSVLNLVVVAGRPEIGEHCAATISQLTGKHPSRTLILSPADPDGPAWIDGQIQAHCILPRPDAPETCAEIIYLTAGGEAGRHLRSIVAPLLIHDLPVTVWWPGEPPFGKAIAAEIVRMADRIVVDGSSWSGNGLARLRSMAALLEDPALAVTDFALSRQSRWREAIASTFDMPDFLPYLRSIRAIEVAFASHDETGLPGSTNVVKPLYHVAWLASRLGLSVERPLHAGPTGWAGEILEATLRSGPRDVSVALRPVASGAPSGTTLRVDLYAVRRGSELRVEVTAEAETVHVSARRDDDEVLDRTFHAARRTEVDLLAEALELSGRDPVGRDALRVAAELAS